MAQLERRSAEVPFSRRAASLSSFLALFSASFAANRASLSAALCAAFLAFSSSAFRLRLHGLSCDQVGPLRCVARV